MPFCFGSLNENRQAVYTDPFGVTSTADGPGLHTWSCCTSVEERDALVLEEFDYVRIMNNADGQRRSRQRGAGSSAPPARQARAAGHSPAGDSRRPYAVNADL